MSDTRIHIRVNGKPTRYTKKMHMHMVYMYNPTYFFLPGSRMGSKNRKDTQPNLSFTMYVTPLWTGITTRYTSNRQTIGETIIPKHNPVCQHVTMWIWLKPTMTSFKEWILWRNPAKYLSVRNQAVPRQLLLNNNDTPGFERMAEFQLHVGNQIMYMAVP